MNLHEETEKREELKYLDYDATHQHSNIFRPEVNNVLHSKSSCLLLISVIFDIFSSSLREKWDNWSRRSPALKQRLTVGLCNDACAKCAREILSLPPSPPPPHPASILLLSLIISFLLFFSRFVLSFIN